TPASAPSAPASNSYAQIVVDQHNAHRLNHSAPAAAWSQALADTAMQIAQTCSYGHSMNVNGGNYGQNIAAGAPVSGIGSVITEQFYNGEVNDFVDYGQPTPADFEQSFETYGHFTQVVWVGSTAVGCASFDCSKQGLANVASNVPPIFHVCNYQPAGKF
ncbi:PR-1-like protein, partial [Microthyrium microscopicum]